MARTKPIRRSYGAGEWGRNRVRVFPALLTGHANCQCGNGLCELSIHNAPSSIPHYSASPSAAPEPASAPFTGTPPAPRTSPNPGWGLAVMAVLPSQSVFTP